MAGKEKIKIEAREPIYYLDQEVTYAQADAWFGHVTRDLRMDIIYPEVNPDQSVSPGGENKKYPCIVWICGGGWVQMDKGAHLAYLTDLARRGFTVASVEYRLGHEAPFPGALIDIKTAIRYLRAHAKRYSIDTEKFGAAGESAGGYLAAMIALAGNSEFESGGYMEQSSAVQAVCPWYMPCDLSKMSKDSSLRPMFFAGDINDDNYCRYINPISYITPKAPPFLLLHGTEDKLVPFEQSEMIYEALTANKVDARLVGLEGEDHAGQGFFQRPVWDMIAAFFKEKLV